MARLLLFVFSAKAWSKIGAVLSSCERATVSAQAGYGASTSMALGLCQLAELHRFQKSAGNVCGCGALV
jgi:hypothetical protein